MGFSKLHFQDYIDNIDYWLGTMNVQLPKWATDVAMYGGKSVSAVDFYEDLFGGDLEPHRMPEDYRSGEYAAIALEICPNENKNSKSKFIGKRRTITQDLTELFDLIDTSENFCMMSPISYCGKHRTVENARYLYAMVIEIDGVIKSSGMNELFYSWERMVSPLPKPTYVVCSGGGVHLYFVFEKPIPLWKNVYEQLNKARQELIPRFWNTYVSKEKIQYESAAQGFRIVGTRAKQDNVYVMAFEVGKKVSIEYMNSFIRNEDNKILNFYKSSVSLEEAKEKYPEWYQRRIENGESKQHWYKHQGIYHNWIEKIAAEAEVGHRYHCLEALCALAVQCNIPPEQLENDCRHLMMRFESLTNDDQNHFTEHDVLCAIKTYHQASQNAYERNIDVISNKTGIQLLRNKRNGRKQHLHLKLARANRDILCEERGKKDWREGNGRKSQQEVIRKWQAENPDGKKADCIRETGLSKPTVYKWWNS